ncbi:KTSC domain-containing protein [Capnocytophaga catalasegens]|uniref:KTSC domain-containing protein n=1 Tax=Capnocytophaga catalasegens TaxID=1004260 RepID=UPI002231B0F2|nr:KTSC domain-containing protein [Capnocytophaga catalasegens]
MISVRSSVIRAVDYNPLTKQLFIKFHSGYTYVYYGVPESIFRGLLRASSKDSYFNTYIRGRYE